MRWLFTSPASDGGAWRRQKRPRFAGAAHRSPLRDPDLYFAAHLGLTRLLDLCVRYLSSRRRRFSFAVLGETTIYWPRGTIKDQ